MGEQEHETAQHDADDDEPVEPPHIINLGPPPDPQAPTILGGAGGGAKEGVALEPESMSPMVLPASDLPLPHQEPANVKASDTQTVANDALQESRDAAATAPVAREQDTAGGGG